MAGRGRGRARGLSNAKKLYPPLKDTISRWFQKRNEYTLLDKLGNDANLLPPVSVFDGVDGAIYYEAPSDDTSILFEAIINSITSVFNKHLFISSIADLPGSLQIRINSLSRIQLIKRGVEVIATSAASVNPWDKIRIFYDTITNVWNITINDIEDSSGVYVTGGVTISSSYVIFARTTLGSESFFGSAHSVRVNDVSIPLPHTGKGYKPNAIDPTKWDTVELEVNGGVTEGFPTEEGEGSLYTQDVGAVLLNGEYIPNKPDGARSIEGGTYISGSLGRMNITPSYVRLYVLGQLDSEYAFFDKSNALIWKQTVRDSVYYDSSNTGDWHNSELTQQYIYDNIQDAYKYQLWSKIQSGVFKDIFLYPTSLEGDNICKAKKYVGVGEEFATIEDATYLCDTDTLTE